MKKAKLIVNKNYTIGTAEKGIFSAFVEHMGRCVYGGIYEPSHKTADENGFRNDVIDAVSEMGVDKIRYPGGNFVSGYDWEDGIGRKQDRKPSLNLAWFQTEPNEVGVDEFMAFSEKTGCPPVMAVNLGVGSPMSAAHLVEYCNLDTPTKYAMLRKKNGREKPYGIRYWCLGNEMDGSGQIGSKSAEEYGDAARETAKLMKWVDRNILVTLCGSSGSEMPSYPEWDRIVLERAYEQVDFISLHKYYGYPELDKTRRADFLASYVDFDKFISVTEATVNYVKCKTRSKKDVYLSVDEWNVWHKGETPIETSMWGVDVPREENSYNMLDAAVFSTLIGTLVNHANSVKIACLAQLVNVLAPIVTEKDGRLLKQSIFYPFKIASEKLAGTVYNTVSETGEFDSVYGKAREVFFAAVSNGKRLTVLAVNLADEDVALTVETERFNGCTIKEITEIYASDPLCCNTFESPEAIKPVTKNPPAGEIQLKPYSVNFIDYETK